MAGPANYGQLTGYTEIPGYGYEFETAGGGKRKLPASPGNVAAAQAIDAARAAGLPAAVPAYNPGAGPLAPPVGPEGGPAQAGPAPARFDPLASAKGGGEIGVRAGGDPANPMDYIVRTPGRAASKGGMQARGMTSQGGYEVDEQYLQQKEASDLRMQAIHEQAFQRGQDVAAERSGMLKAQQQQAERDLGQQAKENAEKEKRLGEYQAKLDKAEAAYTGFSKEKEREANSPQGKLTTFVNTLSSALGALGAGLARTPNFAAEAVQRHNEMQLRREEAELRVRKDNRDNLLGQLQREMGSLDLAKSAYRAIQAKQGALAYEALAQKEKDVDRQKSDLLVAEMLHQQALGHRESYLRNSAGEVTRTFQYVPGQAGSRGGYRAPTIEELKGLQDLRAGEASIGKTQADTAKSLAASDPNRPAHLGQRAQAGIVAARNARTAIQEMADALGVKRDEKGEYKDPSIVSTVKSKIPFTDIEQKVEALKMTAVSEIGKAQIGGVLSEAQAKEGREQIAHARTPGQIGALLRHYEHTMKGVEKNYRDVAKSSGAGSDEPDDEGH